MLLRLLLLFSCLTVVTCQVVKVPLGPANVIHAFGLDWYTTTAAALCDEQTLAADPKSKVLTNTALLTSSTWLLNDADGKGGAPIVPWDTPWDATWYSPQVMILYAARTVSLCNHPLNLQIGPFAIIDLNGTWALDSVWMYRSWGGCVI
jgi:hypothetical protein